MATLCGEHPNLSRLCVLVSSLVECVCVHAHLCAPHLALLESLTPQLTSVKVHLSALILLAVEVPAGIALYTLTLRLARIPEPAELLAHIRRH